MPNSCHALTRRQFVGRVWRRWQNCKPHVDQNVQQDGASPKYEIILSCARFLGSRSLLSRYAAPLRIVGVCLDDLALGIGDAGDQRVAVGIIELKVVL